MNNYRHAIAQLSRRCLRQLRLRGYQGSINVGSYFEQGIEVEYYFEGKRIHYLVLDDGHKIMSGYFTSLLGIPFEDLPEKTS